MGDPFQLHAESRGCTNLNWKACFPWCYLHLLLCSNSFSCFVVTLLLKLKVEAQCISKIEKYSRKRGRFIVLFSPRKLGRQTNTLNQFPPFQICHFRTEWGQMCSLIILVCLMVATWKASVTESQSITWIYTRTSFHGMVLVIIL